jgi:hypothetical protein
MVKVLGHSDREQHKHYCGKHADSLGQYCVDDRAEFHDLLLSAQTLLLPLRRKQRRDKYIGRRERAWESAGADAAD